MAASSNEYDHILSSAACEGRGVSTTSSIPLYYQLYMILQRIIRDQKLVPDSRFPSEEAISAHFNVSRPTANRAIHELIERGWLVRRRGRGTFVQRIAMPQLALLNNSLSFSDDIGRRADHQTEFVTRAILPASEEDALALQLAPGTLIQYVRRLHRIKDRVIMVCDSKLSAARFPDLEQKAYVNGSLFETLRTHYDCAVVRAERCVEAAEMLDARVAELLRIPMFAPILMLTGVAFDEELNHVETMTAYVREGVMFKNVISAESGLEPVYGDACPRAAAPSEGEAC